MRKYLTYANVTSTLALFIALGAGSAYAVDQIGSGDIRNNSIQSEDIRERGVAGRDVQSGALGRRQIDERSIEAGKVLPVRGEAEPDCDVVQATSTECAAVSVRLARVGKLVVVVTGEFYALDDDASADCEIEIDGVGESLGQTPGVTGNNTTGTATDGFARTLVTSSIARGLHRAALSCTQVDGNDGVVGNPTISAFAVTGR